MSYTSEVLADSPLAYYRLDEASGTTMGDSSGNSRAGTYVGPPTLGATSLLASDTADKAITVTANSGQCGSVTHATWMNLGSAFTVEAWASLSSATDGSNGDAIVSIYGSGGFCWLIWRNTTGHWAAQVFNGSGSAFNVAASASVTLNQTYHLVLVFNGSTIELFVDGVSAGSTAFSGSANVGGTSPLDIGRYSSTSSTTPGGTIDDVAIYGTALSSTRIAAHHTAGTATGSSVNLGTAHETDTAHALSRVKTRTLGTAHSTATAHSLGRTKTRNLGTAHETDTAHALSLSDRLGVAHETDAAHPLGRTKTRNLGTAHETDTAHALSLLKRRALSTAHETDTARALRLGPLPRSLVIAELDDVLGVTDVEASFLVDGNPYVVLDPVDGITDLLLSTLGPIYAALDPVDGSSTVTVLWTADLIAVLDPVDGTTTVLLTNPFDGATLPELLADANLNEPIEISFAAGGRLTVAEPADVV